MKCLVPRWCEPSDTAVDNDWLNTIDMKIVKIRDYKEGSWVNPNLLYKYK